MHWYMAADSSVLPTDRETHATTFKGRGYVAHNVILLPPFNRPLQHYRLWLSEALEGLIKPGYSVDGCDSYNRHKY